MRMNMATAKGQTCWPCCAVVCCGIAMLQNKGFLMLDCLQLGGTSVLIMQEPSMQAEKLVDT